jgi:hypothetical protein
MKYSIDLKLINARPSIQEIDSQPIYYNFFTKKINQEKGFILKNNVVILYIYRLIVEYVYLLGLFDYFQKIF